MGQRRRFAFVVAVIHRNKHDFFLTLRGVEPIGGLFQIWARSAEKLVEVKFADLKSNDTIQLGRWECILHGVCVLTILTRQREFVRLNSGRAEKGKVRGGRKKREACIAKQKFSQSVPETPGCPALDMALAF